MAPVSRTVPHTVSPSRGFNALLCALVVASSQAVASHGFVVPNTVRFSYRYGGLWPNADLQGNFLSSSAAAARSSTTAAAASGLPPRAYIRGAAVAAGTLGKTPGADRGEGRAPASLLSSALFGEPSAASAADAELLERVKDVVAEQLKVDRQKIQADSNFIKDLNADSLDSVELVMAFEEKFGITIPDDAATKIATVNDAISYIQAAKASDNTPAGGSTSSQA